MAITITTCCGCIPLRTATAAISLLWMLFSLITGIWALTRDDALGIIMGVLYLLICLGTMFGIHATFVLSNMPMYAHMANIIAPFFIILAIGEVTSVFIRMHDVGSESYCIKGTTVCGSAVYGVYIPYMVVVVFLSIYFAVVINVYARESSKELKRLAEATGPISIPTIPVTTTPTDTELLEDTTVPMNTVPVNTGPMNTVPINSVPINSVPVNSVPVNVNSVAVNVNSVAVNAVPVSRVPTNVTIPYDNGLLINSTYSVNSTVPRNSIVPLSLSAHGGHVPMAQPRASVVFTSAVPNSRITQYIPDELLDDYGFGSLVEVSDVPSTISDSSILEEYYYSHA